jgi:hypothetical protein
MIEEFSQEAELHPEGSRARKLLIWAAIELKDRGEQIEELIETDNARTVECEQLRRALVQGADQMESVVRFMRDAAFTMDSSAFSRDFAGWINLMGCSGDADYLTANKLNPCRHVDLREKPPRKVKAQS